MDDYWILVSDRHVCARTAGVRRTQLYCTEMYLLPVDAARGMLQAVSAVSAGGRAFGPSIASLRLL